MRDEDAVDNYVFPLASPLNDPGPAAHHAQLAHAPQIQAFEHARNAAKEHLKAHAKHKPA